MLNWAARYFPITRALRLPLPKSGTVLEVGSGPFGIGKFYRAPFVGCDVKFDVQTNPLMRPVVASAVQLPFGDQSFDGVVLSDVLEHVPPASRVPVIHEALRVMRTVAIFGFPSGAEASVYDRKLADVYDRKRIARPEWLKEHLLYQPFPAADLFDELRQNWNVSTFDNENVVFHNWVMRQEMHPTGVFSFRVLLALVPGLVEWLLRYADREPYYRKVVVVQRRNGRA